jgi:hypothetical protein
VLTITDTTLVFKVNFDSLDNPDAISLIVATVQDLLVVEIPKTLIMNDQSGNSLVLDGSSFDEEDGKAFYVSVSLEP